MSNQTASTKPRTEMTTGSGVPLLLGVCVVTLTLGQFTLSARAEEPSPVENDFYRMVSFDVPKEIMLEAGGVELLPSGELAVATRRGEIWLVDKPFADSPTDATFRRFAHGLHEVLGLVQRDGWLYATQRGELTRLKDSDGDGQADIYETVNDDWQISGDYHEYAFGSRFDRDGNIWVVLCLTGSFGSDVKYRGWCPADYSRWQIHFRPVAEFDPRVGSA